jgi:hypothetical protein
MYISSSDIVPFKLDYSKTFDAINKMKSILEETSIYMNKNNVYLYDIFTKFAVCFPHNYEFHLNELMDNDDIYLAIYFINRVENDFHGLSEDDTFLVIYFVYMHFLDDNGTEISNIMPCITNYQLHECNDIIIKLSLKYSKTILIINKDLTFISRWTRKLNKMCRERQYNVGNIIQTKVNDTQVTLFKKMKLLSNKDLISDVV